MTSGSKNRIILIRMIREKHSNWAKIIFYPFIKRLISKNFHSFFILRNIEIPENNSLIITPNHFSWWDGFFIHTLCRYAFKNRPMNIMMLEEQLKKYWYFSHVGAYSITPGNRKEVFESLDHTVEILKKKENISVIYPQGEIIPYEANPMKLNKGALRYLAEKSKSGTLFLPVIFKIHYNNKKKPDIIANPGKAVTPCYILENFREYIIAVEKLRDEADASVLNCDYTKGINLL